MDEPIRMADGFLDDLLKLDVAAARDRLHPRVHLRAVEPGSTLGHVGAAAVVADRARQLACWDHIDVLHRRVWRIADRLGLDLRLHLHHGAERWECEQRLYLDLEDGLIHRIDLLSSGCHRLSHGTATTSPHRGE
jgi:hypothetical protein